MRTPGIAALALLALAGCGFDKGRLEGHIEYIDSSWDQSAPPSNVPNLVVHVMPGTETNRREILAAFEPLVARGIPGEHVPGVVELILTDFAPSTDVILAQEVGPEGDFAFEKLQKGSYLVFADYNTDLGYFGWLESVEILGTRTTVAELTYETRLPILMPPERTRSSSPAPPTGDLPEVEPTPPMEVEIPADELPEALEKLGIADANP